MANGIAKVSLELLYHFQCDYCQGWWSIGDFTPQPHKQIYCPHCGLQNTVPEQVLLGEDFQAEKDAGEPSLRELAAIDEPGIIAAGALADAGLFSREEGEDDNQAGINSTLVRDGVALGKERQAQIANLLSQANAALTASQIAKLLGIDEPAVQKNLVRLEKGGKVERLKEERPHLWRAPQQQGGDR